jgi:hypothetical protein
MSSRGWLALLVASAALVASALAACAGRRLPPGTPPPEYEPPIITPWAPERPSGDAGAESLPPPASSVDAGTNAELSLDAGAR